MNVKKIRLLLLTLSIFVDSGFAQDTKIIDSILADTLNLKDEDTTFVTGQTEINEDLSDIFQDRMDSSANTWFLKNAFTSDSAEVNLLDIYPTNIPDSVYIQRLGKAEQVIDLSYNPVVLSFIKMYTERKRNQVERMIGLSEYYFPMFEEALDKYNLPLELKYLPIIESALDPVAASRAGAMGLWQFMYGTAKLLGLDITSFVDERRDPVKATDAAAKYLKYLFDIYNDWHLAIAAYNCGPGNVNRAIRRSGGKTNYWEIYYLLPRETRGYVPLFIAATYVMNYYKEHNLIPQMPAMPTVVDTIMVNNYLHFDQISTMLNLDKENLQALNPMYRRGVIPATADKPYPVVLPQEKVFDFIDKDTAVFAWEREKYFPHNTLVNPANGAGYFTPVDVKGKTKIVYKVKSGDTVGGIAARYRVRVNDLTYWNNIRRNMIRIGQKLAIYVPEKDKSKYEKTTDKKTESSTLTSTDATFSPQNSATAAEFELYTVKSGDNVWVIAQKYEGVTTDDILQLNNISNERGLVVGQKLKIRKKT